MSITSIVRNINSSYMGMWQVTQKLILLVGLSLKEKSMLPVGSYLAWERSLHEDLCEVIAGVGVRG